MTEFGARKTLARLDKSRALACLPHPKFGRVFSLSVLSAPRAEKLGVMRSNTWSARLARQPPTDPEDFPRSTARGALGLRGIKRPVERWRAMMRPRSVGIIRVAGLSRRGADYENDDEGAAFCCAEACGSNEGAARAGDSSSECRPGAGDGNHAANRAAQTGPCPFAGTPPRRAVKRVGDI